MIRYEVFFYRRGDETLSTRLDLFAETVQGAHARLRKIFPEAQIIETIEHEKEPEEIGPLHVSVAMAEFLESFEIDQVEEL